MQQKPTAQYLRSHILGPCGYGSLESLFFSLAALAKPVMVEIKGDSYACITQHNWVKDDSYACMTAQDRWRSNKQPDLHAALCQFSMSTHIHVVLPAKADTSHYSTQLKLSLSMCNASQRIEGDTLTCNRPDALIEDSHFGKIYQMKMWSKHRRALTTWKLCNSLPNLSCRGKRSVMDHWVALSSFSTARRFFTLGLSF